MKIRVRFGVRLSWPIANAATFVLRMKESQYDALRAGVNSARQALVSAGYPDIAARLICEAS